jgi:hypothetical protein
MPTKTEENPTIEKQIEKAKDANTDADIMEFLKMISENSLNQKTDKDVKNRMIRELFDEGFEIHDPTGTFKIGSKVIQQALWRVMSKVKFLDSVIHGTGKDEDTERIVTEGVMTVADRGGLATSFRSKGGVFQNAFMFGDGWLGFGKGENDENPVNYRVYRNEDVYLDNFCYGIRGVKPAFKACVILGFDKEEAYADYPELKEAGVYGRIPGSYQSFERQGERTDNDILEIAWGYNIASNKHLIFAGAQAYEMDRFEKEEYPFIKNGKSYIPLFQFLCQPSSDTPWNHGIGEMVYDLAIITRKLMNMEIGHLEENVYPVTLINAPQAKVDELVEKMAMANKARKNGKKPFVAMEFDPNGGQQSVAAQALITQNLFNEWKVMWDTLYKELSRLGINLDDIERGSGITRGQVIAEEQASNAFVLQMMEYNASETKELLECTMDGITEFVSNKNKTSLNLLTRINLPSGDSARLDKDITMGMLSKELKDGNWFVVNDSRTGAIPSDLTKLIHEEAQLVMTPPGTPEYRELYRRIGMRRGIDMTLRSPEATVQPGPTSGAPKGGEPEEPTPAETQRVLPEPLGNVLTPV